MLLARKYDKASSMITCALVPDIPKELIETRRTPLGVLGQGTDLVGKCKFHSSLIRGFFSRNQALAGIIPLSKHKTPLIKLAMPELPSVCPMLL